MQENFFKSQKTLCPSPLRGIGPSSMAPHGGPVFPLWSLLRDQTFCYWPLPQDQTFCYGPSWGTRLSVVAPSGGSDFLLWPLLGGQTFSLAPPGGTDGLLWSLPEDRPPYSGIGGHTAGSLEYSLRACGRL
jgi:hypothetical protein